MKKAIVIGASSGIGRTLAKELSAQGYAVGLAARRESELLALQRNLPAPAFVRVMDVVKHEEAAARLQDLIAEMGDVDVIVIGAGTGHLNPALEAAKELDTIAVNVSGFTVLAGVAYNYFKQRGKGHLVGISSISALRGHAAAPAYNASKAYLSTYLEGLRLKAYREKSKIIITDIKPGFVDTQMAQGEGLFWVAPVEKAARQIVAAIKSGRSHVYVTKRWRLVAWVLKVAPFWLYRRIA